jgi:acyl carrier protein
VSNIQEAIIESINQINLQLDKSRSLSTNDEQVILYGNLDSLGLLTFITILESNLSKRYINIDLMSFFMTDDNEKYFLNIKALRSFIENEID